MLQRILVKNELAWNGFAMLQGMTRHITVRNRGGSVQGRREGGRRSNLPLRGLIIDDFDILTAGNALKCILSLPEGHG